MDLRLQPQTNGAATLLRRATSALQPPANLFSGLRWNYAMAPDNIILFKRTNVASFKPDGVSNNYHHRFELVVVIEKAGPVRIGESTYLLQPQEAALIFPNQFHHYIDVEQGQLEWLFITFELKSAEAIAALKDSPRVLNSAELELLGLIVMEYTHPAMGTPNAVEISHHLARLLRSMANAPEISPERRCIQTEGGPRDLLLEKMNQYVRLHLDEAPTIHELSRALDYSVSHMRTVFRSQLGVSLGRYIRESRLSKAASLLQSTTMNVSEVAKESGFKSLFAFSRAFKKAYGMAPKAYSRLVR